MIRCLSHKHIRSLFGEVYGKDDVLVHLQNMVILCVLGLIQFAYFIGKLGFYADDSAFLFGGKNLNLESFIYSIINYVPGRNLHNVYQGIIYLFLGSDIEKLWQHHTLQYIVDQLNVFLFYLLVLRLTKETYFPLCASILFLLLPNHEETHFWLSSLPMNLMSTCFVLAALFCFLAKKESGAKHYCVIIFFTLALFTYDQVYLLSVVLAFFIFKSFLRTRNKHILAAFIILTISILGNMVLRLSWISGEGGPKFVDFHLTIQNVLISIREQLNSFNPTLWPKYVVWPSILISVIVSYSLRNWKTQRPILKWRTLLFISGIFTLLSYFPNYLWSISPRHNYLPSIGTCIIFGLLISKISSVFPSRLARPAFHFMIIFTVYGFSARNFASARNWVRSWEVRQAYYRKLIEDKGLLTAQTCIFIKDAPMYVGKSPCVNLFHEAYFVPALLTGRKIAGGDFVFSVMSEGICFRNFYLYYGKHDFRYVDFADVLIYRFFADGDVRRIGLLTISEHYPVISLTGDSEFNMAAPIILNSRQRLTKDADWNSWLANSEKLKIWDIDIREINSKIVCVIIDYELTGPDNVGLLMAFQNISSESIYFTQQNIDTLWGKRSVALPIILKPGKNSDAFEIPLSADLMDEIKILGLRAYFVYSSIAPRFIPLKINKSYGKYLIKEIE